MQVYESSRSRGRVASSSQARFVKDVNKMRSGGTPWSSSVARRARIVVVFPVPAAASTCAKSSTFSGPLRLAIESLGFLAFETFENLGVTVPRSYQHELYSFQHFLYLRKLFRTNFDPFAPQKIANLQ